ncbi:phytanoyl-CoA dioxygenase family protein [Nibricoccus sp. IMCC34717]|uniref:phytanoyl-CoA dioxygenase family protein n=1 Tax=Nibricoccus sp. IMCC34717 TaxID=3034021 RepID=UPI003850E62F
MNAPTHRILPVSGGPSVEADLARLQAEFDATGCLVLPGFLAPHELQPIQAELDAYYAPIEKQALALSAGHKGETAKFACDVVPWDPVKDGNTTLTQLWHHDRLATVTECVLGPGFLAPSSLVMFSVGGGRGQAWHQDCPSDASADFNLNRLFYTEDVSLEEGAIVVVPGSHRWGRIPPGGHQDPMVGEIALTPRAGTLVLLHGHVYHRVTPNLTPKRRISVNYRAYPAGVSPDVNCIGVYRNGTVNFCDHTVQKADTAMMMAPK